MLTLRLWLRHEISFSQLDDKKKMRVFMGTFACFVFGNHRIKSLAGCCLSSLAWQHSMKSLSLPGVTSQIIHCPNVDQQFWQAGCTVFYMPQCCTSHTSHTHSFCFSSLLSDFSLVFFDWLDSMLISMSHYLLEYSGECFQLLPFQLL